jgi:hypothetical protein
MAQSVTVGIPFLSKKVAKNWPAVCGLLQRSLKSLANQTIPCERVIIGCHERPDISVPDGVAVEFVEVGFPTPRFTWETELDKLKKIEEIGARFRQHGGGKLFLLDGDDLVDKDFIATSAASAAKGVIVGRGYQYDLPKRRLTLMPRF